MSARRVLITGLSTPWGGRLAQVLERDPGIETVVGIDTADPRHQLDRTEFVRVDLRAPLLERILAAAAIDTVIDTRLLSQSRRDPSDTSDQPPGGATTALLDACAAADSPVHKLVFCSSARYYGSESDDPAFFTEDMGPRRPPRTELEREIVEAEQALAVFASRRRTVVVTVLRVASELCSELQDSWLRMLSLPVIPGVLGFDPRLQFVHHQDALEAMLHATRQELPGPYNVAADGVLALSEVASLLGKPLLPILPPWGTAFAARQLRRLGLPIPLEGLQELRFGRGLDNRRLKAAGYTYRYTTREAVLKLRAQQRLRPLLGTGGDSYRYEREVEEFLRWSPSVQAVRSSRGAGFGHGPADQARAQRAPGDHAPPDAFGGYDQLQAEEVIGLISSLEPETAARLRSYEAANLARDEVLEALDRRLARAGGDN